MLLNVKYQHLQIFLSCCGSLQKDFMSLELSEGKVKVNFDLGSGAGSAISAKRHNDGRWKALTMSRNKKQGAKMKAADQSSDHLALEWISHAEVREDASPFACPVVWYFLFMSLKSHCDCGGHRQRRWRKDCGHISGFSYWSKPQGKPENLFWWSAN